MRRLRRPTILFVLYCLTLWGFLVILRSYSLKPTENEELGAAPTNLRQPRSTSSARKEAYKERSKLDDFYIETTDAEDELEAVQYANALSV